MDGTWACRGVLATAWFATVGLALAACGPAPSPEGGIRSVDVEAPKAVVATAKYADELVDPATLPEPPMGQAGGIPPGDLTATPKLGGTIIAGSAPINLDAHFQTAAASGWAHRVFANGLLRWDLKTGTPQPDLAESWSVGKDGMSYDFKIRRGVKFHNLPPVNGRELTVQDIKWSLDRVSGLESRPGKQGIYYRRYENVREFRVIDDTTLRMVMKQPDVQILAEIMHDDMVILPREAEVDNSFSEMKTLIGTGPFIVEYAAARGQYRYKRNPNYWEKDKNGRQLPYLDAIHTVAGDNVAKQAAFKTRQIDWTTLPYANAKGLLGDPNVRSYSGRGMINGSRGLFMNTTIPPFNDIRVRKAVNLALDREEYIYTVNDGPESEYVVSPLGAWQPWHWSDDKIWSLPGYAKGEAKQKEREEAKRLLAEAGYAGGIRGFQYYGTATEAEVVQSQLAAVGIEIKINTTDGLIQRYASFMKDKTIAYAGMGGGHTPDYGVTIAWLCNSVQNMSNYCNPEIDKLFFEERRERDTAKRMQILDRIQQILWDDMPMAPLSRGVTIHLSYTHVKGWRNHWYDINFSQGFQMAYVWLDK